MAELDVKYKFPVYGTQGGGLVRRCGEHYVFVEVPDWGNFQVGDNMPEQWGIASANKAAHQEMDPQIDPFDDGGGAARHPDVGSHWATSDDAL